MSSLTNNKLLVKEEVGKAKPNLDPLPEKDFVYGYKPKVAKEGVKESSINSNS